MANVLTEPDWDVRVPVHLIDGTKTRDTRAAVSGWFKKMSDKTNTFETGLERLYENFGIADCELHLDDAGEKRYQEVLGWLDLDDVAPEVACEKSWHDVVLKMIKKRR